MEHIFQFQSVILHCSSDKSPVIGAWLNLKQLFLLQNMAASSLQTTDKTVSPQILFPPVTNLSPASEKCVFDMTLSKSDEL